VTSQDANIIQAVGRHDSVSRTDLARLTGWSRPKVTSVVDGLIKKSILKEVGEGVSAGGRRPRLLEFNDDLGYLVGVDLGATSLDIALADLNGRIMDRSRQPADVRDDPKAVLDQVSSRVLELCAQHTVSPQRVLGIGIGVPGPVEFSSGTLVAPPLMPAWGGFPIREYLHETFPSARVMVDNDVNIMALGELRAGAAVDIDNMIFVKIGTGIGAGIVCNGSIHRGSNGGAGDIGHICADHSGPMCRCGNIGCLETLAAGPAIAARGLAAATTGQSVILAKRLELNQGVLRAEDVSAAASAGDRAAIEIIQTSGSLIGDVLAGLVNFFNPRMILIGGGVSKMGNQLLASIRQAVLHRSTALATRDLVVNYSPMGAEAGVTGAIHLAREYLFMVPDKANA
jgi:glucokinase-like ROK family protein